MHRPALSALVLLLSAAAQALATGPVTVRPGHPHVDSAAFRPFEAVYVQMGRELTVQVRKSTGVKPVYSVLMIMDNPDGIGVDHIGLFAKDLRFAYRRFTFGRWGRELVHAEEAEGTVSISRMPLPASSGEARLTTLPAGEPFFDGTFLHWILGLLPLEPGYSASLGSWALTQEGAETYTTPPSVVTGREKVAALDGTVFDCWVVRAEGSQATFVNYVVRRPPFLVKQVVTPKEGEPVTSLRLRNVSPGPE